MARGEGLTLHPAEQYARDVLDGMCYTHIAARRHPKSATPRACRDINTGGNSEVAMELQIKGQTVLIDDEDLALVQGYGWCPMQGRYMHAYIPGSGHKGKFVRMHRLIMGASGKALVDHVNGNGFDNRKENLRFCTTSQNLFNRGPNKNNPWGIKGIRYDKRRGRYFASICVNHKSHFLGYFDTPEKAGEAYALAAPKYHGQFART
jgi:hypothetical protein